MRREFANVARGVGLVRCCQTADAYDGGMPHNPTEPSKAELDAIATQLQDSIDEHTAGAELLEELRATSSQQLEESRKMLERNRTLLKQPFRAAHETKP